MKTKELFQLAEWDLKLLHPSLSSAIVVFEKELPEHDKEGLITTFIALSRAWQWHKIRSYSFALFEDVLLEEFSYLKSPTEEELHLRVPTSKFHWTVIEKDQEKDIMVYEYLIRAISYNLVHHFSNLDLPSVQISSKPNLMELLYELSTSPPSPQAYYRIGNLVGLNIEVFRDAIIVKP